VKQCSDQDRSRRQYSRDQGGNLLRRTPATGTGVGKALGRVLDGLDLHGSSLVVISGNCSMDWRRCGADAEPAQRPYSVAVDDGELRPAGRRCRRLETDPPEGGTRLFFRREDSYEVSHASHWHCMSPSEQ
jgi:hypothetical protein